MRPAPETGLPAGALPAEDRSRPESLAAHAAGIAGAILGGAPGVLGLDYDGTLTEIVAEPGEAALSDERRDVLARVVRIPDLRVVILSGRARRDVAGRVGVPGAVVVGNHGLEIEDREPAGAERHRRALSDFLADLARGGLAGTPFHIEDKELTATVHLRGTRADAARDRLLEQLRARLDRFQGSGPPAGHLCGTAAPPPSGLGAERAYGPVTVGRGGPAAPRLALHPGKASVEIRPEGGWDKARAFLHLLAGWDASPAHCFYAGDDVTDECVFAELKEGFTVKIGAGDTAARYRGRDPADVYRFLDELLRQRALAAPEVKGDRS